MRRTTFVPLLLLALLAAAGCSRSVPVAPQSSVAVRPELDRAAYDRLQGSTQLIPQVAEGARRPRVVYVPAGSVDALAAALSQAGPAGFVILRRGTHTENAPIDLTAPVTIAGERGAELRIASGDPSNDAPIVVRPAINVRAPNVVIRDLAILPLGADGNTGILLRDDNATVFRNRISGFQFGVLVEQADRAQIFANDITVSSLWQTGAVSDAHGIVVINGVDARLFANVIRNGVFGVWACDRDGQAWANQCSGCFVGLILCKVPSGFMLIDDVATGAANSAANWLTVLNVTTDNLSTGLLVIDGANNNRIESNRSTGNGGYDVELTGDTYRFGFLTPKSFQNTFVAGLFPSTRVKDCGLDNTIIGGQLVDNTLEPCD